MALVLGIKYLYAKVYSWDKVSFWAGWEARELQCEAILKRLIYDIARDYGSYVFSVEDDSFLGNFIQVDTESQGIGLFRKFTFLIMVEQPNKQFDWYPLHKIRLVPSTLCS